MIDVALRRRDARPAEVAVVVDVLRATTTITCALHAGYRRVIVSDGLERALTLRAPGRVLAGEFACRRPNGFDLGNSPYEVGAPLGEELVLSTTNGAPAIVAAAGVADEVLIGCLLNLDAVVDAIDGRDTIVVCAGVAGEVGVDDVYVAGRIVAALEGDRTDAARTAEAVARSFDSPLAALGSGKAAGLLRAAGLSGDVVMCARESVLDVVPRVSHLQGYVAEIEKSHTKRPKLSLVDLDFAPLP